MVIIIDGNHLDQERLVLCGRDTRNALRTYFMTSDARWTEGPSNAAPASLFVAPPAITSATWISWGVNVMSVPSGLGAGDAPVARSSARVALTFCVWGKEPIVVVGKSGSEMAAACAV